MAKDIDTSMFDDCLHLFSEYYIRDPKKWKFNLKTSDQLKYYMSYVKYVFCKYHVPAFLDMVWKDDMRINKVIKRQRDIDFRYWYVTIGNGGSLYKEHAKEFMSKKETAIFLKYGIPELTPYQNIWFARCLNLGCQRGWAKNIAYTLNTYPANDFYLSIMRFFIQYPVPLSEMPDLMDCFHGMHAENPHFNLKKRTLDAVRIISKEWHRLEAKKKKYEKFQWDGHAIDDWSFEENDVRETKWKITQILKTNDLIEEGHAMRHCVGSYTSACSSGRSSIWSVVRCDVHDVGFRRVLTIELRDNGYNYYVGQIRGYANRPAKSSEMRVVNRWLNENDIRNGRWP